MQALTSAFPIHERGPAPTMNFDYAPRIIRTVIASSTLDTDATSLRAQNRTHIELLTLDFCGWSKQNNCIVLFLLWKVDFSTALRATTNVASFDHLNHLTNPIHNRTQCGFEINERGAPFGQRNCLKCVISYLGFYLISGAEIFYLNFSLQERFTYILSALGVRHATISGVPRKSVTPPF